MSRQRLKDKVTVVTGASSGVGRAIARAFAQEGAKVALIARGREGLEAAAREISVLGSEALVLPLDVSEPSAVNGAADEVIRKWGHIDVWVNDAMVSVFAPVVETTAEEYRRVTEVNYLGFVYGTQAALRTMRPRNSGVIIQIGSALAYRSIPLQSAYCASKRRSAASPIRCAASSFARRARYASPCCTCRRSTRRSSNRCATASERTLSPCRRSTSPS